MTITIESIFGECMNMQHRSHMYIFVANDTRVYRIRLFLLCWNTIRIRSTPIIWWCVYHFAKLFYRCKCYGYIVKYDDGMNFVLGRTEYTLLTFRVIHFDHYYHCHGVWSFYVEVERCRRGEQRRRDWDHMNAESGKPSNSSEWIQLLFFSFSLRKTRTQLNCV